MYGHQPCFTTRSGWAAVEMTRRLFIAVCLLWCVLVGAQSLTPTSEGLLEDFLCASALNRSSSNESDLQNLSQLAKSFCREFNTDCMGYWGTVSMKSDSISHTGATSTIRVAINPNSTAGQEEFYYTFCISYNYTDTYELVACASNHGEELEVQHQWRKNGLAHVRVGVFYNGYNRDIRGCNITETIVAGHFGLKMGVQLLDNQHMVTVSPTHILTSPSTLLPVTNTTNNTYTTGNLTFVPKPEVGEGNSSVQLYRYVYVYDYGDNSSVEEQSDFNSTHYYERPGNYSYSVEGFALYVKDIRRAYYAVHRGQITILDPVSNASVRFNNNNSIIADTKVYLHVCANGSFPISVCWTVQKVNGSNSSQPLTSPQSHCSSSSSSSDTDIVCHSITGDNPCPSYIMYFSDKGRYDMVLNFSNKVSCVRLNYTFHVVAASKPPIVATTTSVGVVVAIVLAVIVVLIILAVGGYLPYRRYRNHMIETADFKFIDLSEKKPSAWARIKLKMLRLVCSRKKANKIGLVNLIDDPQRPSSRNRRSPSSSSSSGSCNNYNAI